MKNKLTLIGLFFVSTYACLAQDVITTRDSQIIITKVIEMNIDQVMFKYIDNLDGSTYMFQKSDIVSIHFQNGRVELYQGANTITTSSPSHDVIVTRDSQIINAKVVAVSIEQIMFKYMDNLDGSTYMFQKKDVTSIHYQNGRVEIFQPEGVKTVQYNQNQPQNQYRTQYPNTTYPLFIQSELTSNGGLATDSEGREERLSINFGFMMGGGLIGIDLEALLGKRLGLQFGFALSGMDISINYHFSPYINSSFISLQYIHIGLGRNNVGATLGPMLNFRAKKLFQAGIGWGVVVSRGPMWTNAYKEEVTMLFQFNIGLYIPL